eukprot:2285118-Amphidinium_carterae.1
MPDEIACEEAAFAIDHTWMGTVNEADSPRGCFRYIASSEEGNVYFNTHEAGLAHDDKRIICSLPVPQLTIAAEDWIIFDMDTPVSLTNVTIFGKLSFDDRADRLLEVEHLIVWGLLEIGTKEHPFGWWTGAKATIKLAGSVTDTETYVYIEEETLHNKLFAVPGRIETYGVPVPDPWLRIHASVSPGAESACLVHQGTLNWTAGSEIAFSPTETSKDYFSDVENRTLTQDAVYDAGSDCWTIVWSGGLLKGHFAGDIEVGGGKTVSLRAVVTKMDRTVNFD